MILEALARAAATGDWGAFTALVGAVNPTLWRFIYLAVGNRQVADEKAGASGRTRYRSLAGLPPDDHFLTWLFQIARQHMGSETGDEPEQDSPEGESPEESRLAGGLAALPGPWRRRSSSPRGWP